MAHIITSSPYTLNAPIMGATVPYMGATVPYMGEYESTQNVPYMGRSVMPDFATAKSYSANASWNPPFNVDLQKALWTAQVLAFWLTDGRAYKVYSGMEGLVTKRGHNPSDPSKVLNPDGYAKTDLRALLNPIGDNSTTFVNGPDSLWGDKAEAESVLVEYIGTGKFFGASLPSQFTKTKAILDTLIAAVSTPAIDAVKAKRAQGQTLPSRTETAKTPCSDLDDAAYNARADCPKPRSGSGSVPQTPPPVASQTPPKKDDAFAKGQTSTEEEPKEDNTMLYIGLGLLGLAVVGGVGYYMHQKKKSAIDKSKALPAPQVKSED